jgi:hypothetical protein
MRLPDRNSGKFMWTFIRRRLGRKHMNFDAGGAQRLDLPPEEGMRLRREFGDEHPQPE